MSAQELAIEAITPESTAISIEGISTENAPSIFGHNRLHHFVKMTREAVIGEVPDLTTSAGRKRIASLAASVARSKVAVDDRGREYLKALKAIPKVIEAELREFNKDMDSLRDEVRKPLDDWDAKQEATKAALQAAFDNLEACYSLSVDASADELASALATLTGEALTVEVFGARLEEAHGKRTHGISQLTARLAQRVQYEKELAELEEGRRTIAALEETQRLEAIKQEAVADLLRNQQSQRDADAQRVRDAEEKARQADERAAQAIEDARKAEAERIEQLRLDEVQRAADRQHCGRINKAALDALLAINMAGEGQPAAYLKPGMAKLIVAAIIRGQIPAVSITY